MKIGIVGLGLMGGSLAKAINKFTDHTIFGVDKNPKVIRQALDINAIDREGNIAACDVVFVCLYPDEAVQYICEAEFKPNAVVTDISGVKRPVWRGVKKAAQEKGIRYIGSHPMAGKEKSGFEESEHTLFFGASYIITCDGETDEEACALIEVLATKIGFTNVVRTHPEDHDRIIAYTSQLAHVVSNSYVKSRTAQEKSGYTAGSFEDLTRVAKLNPEMWTQLFLKNADYLVDEIDEFIKNLTSLRVAIAQGQEMRVLELLKEGSEIKEQL